MAMISCPECNASVSSEAATCPGCGVRIKPKAKVWRWVLGVPVVLVVAMLVIGAMSGAGDSEKTRDRRAYEMCLDSLSSADRARSSSGGFIAGACEKMRQDFQERWGTSP